MRVLIVEDELPAAKRLAQILLEYQPEIHILATIDSVSSAVNWLQTFPAPDLIFLDIQLADGVSFDIFTQTEITSPIIFTTAYDQYALKAFKVNSVDYLLKPIDPDELCTALEKYEQYHRNVRISYDSSAIRELIHTMTKKEHKERFLVKVGQQLQYIRVEDIAYFYSDAGMVHLYTHEGKHHILDYTLDQLENLLDPDCFFRISRKFVINICAIQKIHTYFNSRLRLELQPSIQLEVVVSRDRVSHFKNWLDK